jgi:hypothetical protein
MLLPELCIVLALLASLLYTSAITRKPDHAENFEVIHTILGLSPILIKSSRPPRLRVNRHCGRVVGLPTPPPELIQLDHIAFTMTFVQHLRARR